MDCRPLRPILIAVYLLANASACLGADDSLTLYFDQLRQRGLFSIAESYAVARLGQSNVPVSRRIDLTIELSRTLAQHAEYVSEAQQHDLWKRARSVVDEERTREATAPFAVVLATQAAMVTAGEADWLKVECELRPFDDALADRTMAQCTDAIKRLMTVEHDLLNPPRAAPRKDAKDAPDAPTSHSLRVLLHQVRLALARSMKNRAELRPADSRERMIDLVDAELTARKLLGTSDEPTPFRAKLLLAGCLRLKKEYNRAEEMLAVLEKGFPSVEDNLIQEVAAERVRMLLDQQKAPNALQLIVDLRANQQRLSGEMWYLQTRCLFQMRELATSKKNTKLAEQLQEQAVVTLERCDDQVGGFWSRRCHQLWEATRTAEMYGPELDRVMQQAKADFLGARTEAALKGYARAELLAKTAAKPDLALEMGYTRASILLQGKQYEDAATDFLRLASEYPQSPRAASAHLNGAYCLGRFYDEQKTKARRERYTEELDRHIELFAEDPTAGDARFMKAQLEEQRLQATQALPLYLSVPATHARGPEAFAGAARCYETILIRMRDRKLPTADVEKAAVMNLEQFLADSTVADTWSAPQCEVAVHLAAILIMIEPPKFHQAEPLLTRVLTSAAAASESGDTAARWKHLHSRAESLRVIALAGNGKPLEAERAIDSLAAASPRDLLVIVERLAPIVSGSNRQRQIVYVNLQLHAAAQLEKHRSLLTKEEQNQLDQSLARAQLANGETTKAVAAYEKQAAAAPKEPERQKQIATLLEETGQKDCIALAKQCWKRVEALSEQGSVEWLTARLGIINTSIQLNQMSEASKLLALTRLLHPELGGPELTARYEAAERKLSATKSASKSGSK